MRPPQITNRKGPNCELTVRIKFADLDRFRADYREQFSKSQYFLKSNRNKPEGTRLQLVFVIEDQDDLEVWSWGVVDRIVTPEDALATGEEAGMALRLMDMSALRRKQIEQLFGTDEAIEIIKQRHKSTSPDASNAGYVQVSRSARQEQISGIESFLLLAESADHYRLLGIPNDADEKQVRRGFRDRTRKYHPDQHFRKIPEELHEKLSMAFQKVTEAQRTLLDTTRRAVYDTSIGNYANPEAQRRAMPHVRLQEKFKELYEELIGPRAELIKGLLDEANEHIDFEDYRAARSKLKLAVVYDPLNRKLKTKLKEVEALMPPDEEGE